MAGIIKMKMRYIFMILGIVLFLPPLSLIPQFAGEVNMCGAVCPRMFFIIPSKWGANGLLNNISSMWFGVMLVSAILLSTLFLGRLWCSHVCPVGGVSELANRGVPDKLKMNFFFVNAPAFRYGYLFVYIAGALIGIGSIACKLCNFRVIPFLAGAPFVPAYRTYLATSMGIAGIVLVGMLTLAVKDGRAYCNLLCPVGALDSIVNFLGSKLGFAKRMNTEHSKCNNCGSCIDSCMVWALTRDREQVKRDQLSCMSCRECEKTCPNGAISYGKHKI